jgi:hypothetical protein
MALWELDGATAKMEESSERDLITASAKFTWPDRDRELELVGEMHSKRDDWSLRRLVCTIARPADQGGFKLRLVVDWPKGETRRLFYECLGFCDGVEPSPTVDDGPSTGSLYGVPDHVCEVRMRDSRIVAVAPASVVWHIAYGTWSYAEGKWGERPRVVLTCTEDVPEMARKTLLEITRGYEGLDSTQRAYVDSILADIDAKVERWRSANGDVDAALERQLEDALSSVEWTKHEDYIESERLNMASYEFDYFSKIRR